MSDAPDPLSLLGHDIRAAVSDVIGGLRLIDRAALPPTARAQVERVHAASELLARLVEEVLAGPFSEGRLADLPGVLSLPRFLADELRRWHGHAVPSGTRVSLDRSGDLPDVVRLDQLRLRRIVSNLMGNALRHAAGGAVELAARREADALVIEVRDDGPGFPADRKAVAFEPAASGAGSTGMGLHIARAHAEGLGGALTVADRPGGGAVVSLVLPEAAWRHEAARDLPDLAGWRVLVADDSQTNQLLLAGMLAEMGAECEVAGDGIEALNWLARERFDLAVIDLEMPSLGGLEVIRSERLRQARGVAPPTPLVAMTAYVLRDNRDAILAAGAEGILSKPLGTVEEVGALLAHHLDGRPRSADWTPDAAPPLNAALLADLLAAMPGDARAAFLDGLKSDFHRVEQEMAEGASARHPTDVAAAAHALLSLAGVVGALPVQASARALLSAESPGDMLEAAPAVLSHLAELRALLAQTSGKP